MFRDKKGLSTVVTTLIIILLVLVAIGIIWIVIRGVVESGAETADFAVKCLEVDIRATNTSCSGDPAVESCTVTLSRKAGGDAIAGVKLVFTNATGSSSAVLSVAGNVAPLTTTTTASQATNMLDPNKVLVTAYFLDSAGIEQLCTTTTDFSYTNA